MDFSAFTAFDIGVAVIVLISALLAWARGVTREILGLLAWAGAVLAAYFFWGEVYDRMLEATQNEYFALGLTFLVAFLLPLVVGKIIASAIGKRVDASGAGGVDRLVGLIYGLARGAFVVAAVFLGVSFAVEPETHPDWMKNGISYDHVARAASWLGELVPEGISQRGQEAAESAAQLGGALGAVAGGGGGEEEGESQP